MRFGEYAVALLERYGVRHVFGIPGVHTAELYRGLSTSGIRHITPRHEQGAGFMADGYARLTGRPGVCFVITGPGVTNISTAMAQAYADSIPLLVISSVNATGQLGHANGNLHELPDQRRLAGSVAAFSHTLLRAEDFPAVLARAFTVFESGRPRPVHIEIPLDVIRQDVEGRISDRAPAAARPMPPPDALDAAADTLAGAERPLILAGGGARDAADSVVALAERLDAPVVMTANGRGLLPFRHRLGVSASASLDPVRALIADADVVLAVGTELGPTDYDMYGKGGFSIPGHLVRLDIDPLQLTRNGVAEAPLGGDAAVTAAALLQRLGGEPRDRAGAARVSAAVEAALASLSPAMRRQVAFLDVVRNALPRAVIVGDSTQAIYAGNLYFEAGAPQGWFNSATGYGTLGYALPAAIGAKLGAPDRPVVCLAGDGGLQFTLAELGSAIDAETPIIVLLWNNCGYGEIKSYFAARDIPPIGVDLTTPDFCALARAYGWQAERLDAFDALSSTLRAAAARNTPTLVEIDEALVMQ